jgi:hypothetical protein
MRWWWWLWNLVRRWWWSYTKFETTTLDVTVMMMPRTIRKEMGFVIASLIAVITTRPNTAALQMFARLFRNYNKYITEKAI